MLQQDVRAIADRWWAREFACSPEALRPATTHVQAHAAPLEGASRIWILVAGGAPLVSLPPWAMDRLAEPASRWTSALVADGEALRAAVAPFAVERIVGPAWIGYGPRSTLQLASAGLARQLGADDAPAIGRLRAACSQEEWEHGGSDPSLGPVFGTEDDAGRLHALAGYKSWGEEIAHLSIVSAPAARGRGHATAAVAHAARHALVAGLLPQYRTLAANAPSMGIARRLGFVPYGFSVSVRLGVP